jgi:aminoglycoside/choline kinase family phosphotransferase
MSGQIGHLAANERSVLLDYNAEYYWRWIQRAVTLNSHPGLRAIANAYAVVVEHLLGLSRTIVHGEFYPSNILIRSSVEGPRVCPVDWETAAIGPGLVDLAALTAGKWSSEQCSELARHYYEALGAHNPWLDDWDGFLKSLKYCRLHLAVQWLGWSADWMPPADHAQDWLRHALSLAAELGLANRTDSTD